MAPYPQISVPNQIDIYGDGRPAQTFFRVVWQKYGHSGPGAWSQHKAVGLYLATNQKNAETVVSLLLGARVLGSMADKSIRAIERLQGRKFTDGEVIALIESQVEE